MRRFASDARAASDVGTVLMIVFIIVIPLLLFVALFVYLRRSAPGGEVQTTTVRAEPTSSAGPLAGSKSCSRCGFVVKAHKLRQGSQCPNCGSGLAG